MKRLMTIGLMATLLSAVLCGCHDDNTDEPQPQPVTPTGAWSVGAVTGAADGEDGTTDAEPSLAWLASYESLTVSIAGRTEDTRAIVVSVTDNEDDWLTVTTDTLATDSIVALVTTTNDTGRRRTATLVFTDADNPTLTGTLLVAQRSQADGDTNGNDAQQQLYIGYGYNIYKALESPMSVRTMSPILDLDLLRQWTNKGTYEIIHDCHLARTDIRYVATNSIHAYGRDLTVQQTGATDHQLEGCTEDCKKMEGLLQKDKGTLEQQNFGHGSLEKAVYARVIDKAALLDLRRRGYAIFTDAFTHRLYNIRNTTGTKRQQLIEQLVLDYGTHVVLQVDLGGRIDYSFTMQKSVSFNSEEEMKQEIEYTLGRKADNDRTAANKDVSSSKSATGAITIKGGSTETRTLLQNAVNKMSPTGQIDPSSLVNWLATINYSQNPASDPNLEVIHFELLPLWDLVDDVLRQDFLDAILQMAMRSDCQLPASFLGTDIYEFQTKQAAYRTLFDFSKATTSSSLCRLLYFENEPVLEVCSEYVPKIRTDERVTIVYPIHRQQIHMNQGLFLGDGIHQPAYVGFSGGDSYVNPIDSMEPGRIITKFWYVRGNLMLENPSSLDALAGKNRVIQDDVLTFHTDDNNGAKTHNHPLVKVGSKFWTRYDIDHYMLFGETGSGAALDQMQDGVLYTMFQWDTTSEFLSYNGWTWGYAPNTFFESNPNMKWYLPTPDDVRDLYVFLGFNPKALFRGQVSGYEAQFNGYYGNVNLLNQNRYFAGNQRELRYKGELHVISSKSSDAEKDACVLLLKPDYTMQLIDDSSMRTTFRTYWRKNFYPVRPVRGYMFTYPLLTEIKKHQ